MLHVHVLHVVAARPVRVVFATARPRKGGQEQHQGSEGTKCSFHVYLRIYFLFFNSRGHGNVL